MPPVNLPDHFRSTLIVTNANARLGFWSTSIDYKAQTPGSVTALDVASAIAGAWDAVFTTNITPGINVNTRISNANSAARVEAFELVPNGPAAASSPLADPVGIDTDPLPLEVACCVTKQTELRGRANRGRSYIGGLGKSSVVAGAQFNPSWVAGLADAMLAELLLGVSVDLTAVVVSQVPTDRATPIVNFRGNLSPDTQRRRGQR